MPSTFNAIPTQQQTPTPKFANGPNSYLQNMKNLSNHLNLEKSKDETPMDEKSIEKAIKNIKEL